MRVFRLLPATIITAFLLLCVKTVGMVRDTETLFISRVEAQQPEKPSNISNEKPKVAPDQDKSAKKTEEKKSEDKKAEPAKTEGKDSKPSGEKAAEGGAEHGGEGKDEKKEKENPAVSKEIDSVAERRYTDVEVDLLQKLSKRREEIEHWESNVQIKEAALEATEKRIDEKIAQIEAMKKQVSALLEKYNAQEDVKIRSLVKIYENMKPADAARIFDEIEMPILLLVIDSMAEKKASPILAAMNPKKAKQLTVELANERKLSATKIPDSAVQTAETIPPAKQ